MPRIVIIGAGPAGTVAAIILARLSYPLSRYSEGGIGWGFFHDIAQSPALLEKPSPQPSPCVPGKGAAIVSPFEILLIEQHRFPRDKVCGECLSALGIDVLGRLRLRQTIVDRLSPAILSKAAIHADNSSALFNLPRPMWGISRFALDDLLLCCTQESGVRLLQPARCESIILDKHERPIVRIRNLETNQHHDIAADWVIVADGKGFLSHSAGTNQIADLGLKAHFRNLNGPTDAIELFGVRGHYGGIAPIEGGLWNIAFSVPANRIHSDLDGLFEEISHENPVLLDRMRRAIRVSSWLTSPLPRFGVSSHWPRRVIPIGNAAAAIEPIGGEGMGLAMRSAELAADAILEAVSRQCEVNVQKLQAAYRRLWAMRSLACRIGARIVSSPSLSRLAIPLATHTDGPATLALRLIGK